MKILMNHNAAALLKSSADAELKAAVILSWLAVVLVPLSSVLDWFIYPELFLFFLKLRFGAVALFGGILLHIRFARKTFPRLYVFLAAFSLTTIFSLMAKYSGEGYRSDYYIGIIEVMFALVLVPFPTGLYVLILTGMYVIHVAILHLFGPAHFEIRYFVENHVFIIETIIILFFAHRYISRLRNMLHSLNSQNEYFIQVFVHDIKNRLTGGFSLLKMCKAEPKKEYINLALANEQEIHRMVINLFNLFSEDELEIDREYIPVDELLTTLKKTWNTACTAKDIHFTCASSECDQIFADREYTALVWNNLLSNALHHTPTGGTIHIAFSQDTTFTQIRFMNSGRLISEEEQRDLFTKYLTPEKHSAYHKGLGLNYSRMMCSLHGGDIRYSVENGLNTFTVRLPVKGVLPPQ